MSIPRWLEPYNPKQIIPRWLEPYNPKQIVPNYVEIQNKHREEVEATLCTLYDVKLRDDGVLTIKGPPYMLTWKNNPSTFCIDLTLLQEPK